ncbi:MAG: cell division protein FtsQ/DivIB, partial [Candidatus Omnitrophota bacterium]
IFIVVAALLARSFIHGSDYFKVRHIEMKGLSDNTLEATSLGNELLRSYKNKNIFDTSLSSIARNLAVRYPDAKNVAVKRSLPDKLTISFNFRRPIALAGSARYYPVDEDGYLLIDADTLTLGALPSISGVDIRYEGKATRKIDSRELKAALELLKEIRRAKFMAGHRLIRIDASDINDMRFYLDDGLEIRIGFENLKERLELLRNTLKDSRFMKDKIKYIDVRFHDATIGTK